MIASLVFLSATISLFHVLLGVDPRDQVVNAAPVATSGGPGRWDLMSVNDLRFVVAVLDRNAHTLARSPGDLFQLEQCFPQPDALALGEAMIAPAVLGLPLVPFGEPMATFTFVLLVSTLLAAYSMYWLVDEWTGVPAAGVVAGLLYGFHTIRMRDPVHFFVWDNAWTILALLFARRLFVTARWRDAVGLAICCGMQVSGSVYPLLAAVVIAVPLAIWLVATQGVARLRPAQVGLVVASIAAVAWAVLSPYFGMQRGGQLEARGFQFFLLFSQIAPGGMFFPGAALYGLAALGLLLSRGVDRSKVGGDPRVALCVAGFLCLALATGGSAGQENWAAFRGEPPPDVWLPNLWAALETVAPVFETIRSPAALLSGVHTVLCILAGLGAAALLRRLPARAAPLAVVVLIALVYVDTLRPETLGLSPRQRYETVALRPDDERLEFFAALAAMGNSGPLYEVHFPGRVTPRTTEPLLLTRYHGRPTSVCYNSFVVSDVNDLWREIDDPARLSELRGMGFTTLILHSRLGDDEAARDLYARLQSLHERTGDRYLRWLASDSEMTAWEITAAVPPADSRSDPREGDPTARPSPTRS